MLLTSPTPLADALKLLNEKRLVPTALSSADLRDLAAEVKQVALFSARLTQMRPLQALAAGLEAMLEGRGNVADAKLLLAQIYEALGYDAETGGFPQDAPGTVPPALRGSLRDLASQKRMELTITTNYRMVANAAFVKRTTEDEQRRYQFPCFELVRISSRVTPRGFTRRNGALQIKPGDDWPSRFVAAGGELFEQGTRMIALKGSQVWTNLGAGAGGYPDTLGNPFAPFAFGSGFGLREVPRDEALLIGVMEPEDQAAAMPSTLKQALKAQAKEVPKDILAAFDDLEEDGEWLRAAKRKQDAVEAARKIRNRVETLNDVLMNAGTSAGAYKAWATRRRRGWTPLQMFEARRGMRAMQQAITGKQDVISAMRIPGLGMIDFRWSVGPRGLRRIVEDHKIARRIPVILARGKVKVGKTRAFVTHRGHTVVLSDNMFGAAKPHWVLTGYRDKEGGQLANSVKILVQQSLRTSELHILHSEMGAVGNNNTATLRARCKRLAAALSKSPHLPLSPSSP